MFTSHDIATSIQLLTDCNLTVCIFESRQNIKILAASSVSVPLETKFEVIPSKDVGDTF